ncbi:monocarboxylate uptake permease MctP [Bartonella sp. DGB1]|uniref:monocarboxylate uptake permease MctP n=1 Tax=Bartonella sp. DGB1 TaxID=3239807 RepID=UPI00352405BF
MNFLINQTFLVFIFCFASTLAFGFFITRSKNKNKSINEWGLGGRSFGAWLTWFLLGGDFYTAYTIIAVPALVYAVGAYGFFALPYTILVYPFIFVVMPLLWRYAAKHNHITSADIVLHKYNSRGLEFVVAIITGIIAIMPYIALQVIGMSVIFKQLGLSGYSPIILSFLILGLYTYSSGLKAPAFIAFIKDIMIYIVVIVAIAIIPIKLGGYENIFNLASEAFASKNSAGLILDKSQYFAYATLALGSALAGFMYPHTLTSTLASKSENTIKINAIFLPAYTILLGLLALLGYMAYATHVSVHDSNDIVPTLFQNIFPQWFVGFAFAAIVIGALIPASVMSIGASNLFTRNLWKIYINPNISEQTETRVAKIGSLIVMLGALLVIMLLPLKFALNLQLLGGICILQTLPALVFGLFFKFYRGRALLIGWLAGVAISLYLIYTHDFAPLHQLTIMGENYTFYIGLTALLINSITATILSLVLRK